jgi:hypothetical protein
VLKLLLVVAIFAAVTYLVTRALQERGGSGSQQPLIPRPKRPSPPPRPVAPDDDEDFLRELDRKRRRLRKPPDDA